MVVILRRLALFAVFSLAMIVVGALAGVPADAVWAAWPGPLPWFVEGLGLTIGAAIANPKAAGIIALVVTVPFLIGHAASLIPRTVVKDPQRMFTTDQRRAGFARSENRCEMEDFFFFRCKRPAEHGDHWFPHSKGGSTAMDNFVSGCARCNIAKSARVPTFWETQRLVYRRRRYFPPALDPTPGGRYARR